MGGQDEGWPGPSCLCILITVLHPGVLGRLGSRDETHSGVGKGGTWPLNSLALTLQIRKQTQREVSCPVAGI